MTDGEHESDIPPLKMRLAVCSERDFPYISMVAHIIKAPDKFMTVTSQTGVGTTDITPGRVLVKFRHVDSTLRMGLVQLALMARNGELPSKQVVVLTSWRRFSSHLSSLMSQAPNAQILGEMNGDAAQCLSILEGLRMDYGLEFQSQFEPTPPVAGRIPNFEMHPSYPAIIGFANLSKLRARNDDAVFALPSRDRIPKGVLPDMAVTIESAMKRPHPDELDPTAPETKLKDRDVQAFESHVLGLKGGNRRRSNASQTHLMKSLAKGRMTPEEVEEDPRRRWNLVKDEVRARDENHDEHLRRRWGL